MNLKKNERIKMVKAVNQQKNEFKYILLLALFFSFTLFFFGPLEIYFSIYEDVWFDITHIAGLIFLLFGSSFIGAYVVLLLVNRFWNKGYPWITAFMAGTVTAAYVQGNFLPSSFGKMDGGAVNWSNFVWENLLSLAVWCIIAGGCLLGLYIVGLKK